jgi:hypothetical protein
MADATSGAGTPEFIPVFSGVRIARGLVFCVVFCMSLFVLLYFFFWPLRCLSFFDLHIHFDYPFGIFKLFFTIYKNSTFFKIGFTVVQFKMLLAW